MGALTNIRKRVDESFSLYSPFQSLNSPSFHRYSNQIDTRLAKKPKISSVIDSPEKLDSSPKSIVSRLQRYPEPTRPLPREVHAPCRVTKCGFLSSSSGALKKSRGSGFRERADDMGNVFNVLRGKYEQAKTTALGSLQHVKMVKEADVEEPPSKTDIVVSEDSSDVQIVEDGNEVRSVISDDHRAPEPDGLVPESHNLDKKVLENGIALASSSAMSDLSKVEEAKKMLGSLSLDREAYKNLLGTVERNYSGKLRTLQLEIDVEMAKLHSIRSLQSLKQELEELKKPEEPKKTEKDSLHEPFVPLTEEEQEEVAKAFSNANRNNGLHNLPLLKGKDAVIVMRRLIGGRNGYDYKSVRRWTTQKKLGYGLIDCDKIFVPIHKEVHWCLAVINKMEKKFQYLDSLGGRDAHVLKVLARYFVDEVKDKSGQDIDVSSWDREYVEDLPEQQNGLIERLQQIKIGVEAP
ncbi:hypothetical protein Cgig2_024136 [Carnegiea gigantea]|uniref:Ubiquitin-like protease family profile domain-containing protein n=1 Tax=Carnegiea gigantea TaxID=171969 RepID=A0A9Q1JKA1_9CARY|nr:hypothetical protein Cgig2_024136 [Carnegiea gigantea]